MRLVLFASVVSILAASVGAFSLSMTSGKTASRRSFLSYVAATTGAVIASDKAFAATPEIFTTKNGIKYATLKEGKGGGPPQENDFVAIEYTGYLTDGEIFDGTHAEGKGNALAFNLGSRVVIPGINEMLSSMRVGQKVQCIIPPKLAFGKKGLCLDNGECLIKGGATVVYDIYLKNSGAPP